MLSAEIQYAGWALSTRKLPENGAACCSHKPVLLRVFEPKQEEYTGMKFHPSSRKSVRLILRWSVLLLSLTLMTGNSVAKETAAQTADPGSDENTPKPVHQKMSLEEMSKKLDNPLSDLWMLWMQNDNFHYNGDISSEDRALNVTYFEPVISIPISDKWNLVNRPVLTRINAQVPDINIDELKDKLGGLPHGMGLNGLGGSEIVDKLLNEANWSNKSGWGDMVFLSMISPQNLPDLGKGKLAWGAGITTMWPIASRDLFGSEKYSAGPAGLAMYMGPKWKFGVLAQQWNSYAGDNGRASVNSFNAQYFWFYQLPHLWQIGAAPSITADWNADSNNRWTVPLGIGVNKTFMVGKLPLRIAFEVHKTVLQPDNYGQDWNFRVVLIPIIPNLVKMYQGKLKLPD